MATLIGQDSAPSAGKTTLRICPIAPAFQHLRLVVEGRSTYNATNVPDVSWGLQLNDDPTCYYDWQQLRANWAAVGASAGGVGSEVRAGMGTIPAAQALAICSGSYVVDLPNYRDAIWGQHMISRGSEVWHTNEGSQAVMLYTGFYAKQAAVTSVTAILDLGIWQYGSSMYLYGW